MSNFQFQTFIDNTVIDATSMSNSALVASFAAHGCGDFSHFINFDRDSLIDLYVADVCYDGFYSLYARLLNTL